MDFRLSSAEEGLRKKVEEFVRDELIPLEPEFLHAPDIFEGSRSRRAKLSRDPEIRRYIEIMEGLEKKAEAAGLWYLARIGGLDVSNVAMIAVTEELERTSTPSSSGTTYLISFLVVEASRSTGFCCRAFVEKRLRHSA